MKLAAARRPYPYVWLEPKPFTASRRRQSLAFQWFGQGSPPHASGYSRAYASRCARCGAILDRDCNAALNILNAAGLAEPLNTHGDDISAIQPQTGHAINEVRTLQAEPCTPRWASRCFSTGRKPMSGTRPPYAFGYWSSLVWLVQMSFAVALWFRARWWGG